MGQEPGAVSAQMTEARDPEQIHREIEETRSQLVGVEAKASG